MDPSLKIVRGHHKHNAQKSNGSSNRKGFGVSVAQTTKNVISQGLPIFHRLRAHVTEYVGVNSALGRGIRRHRLIFCLLLCGFLSALSYTVSFYVRFELSPVFQVSSSWEPWWMKTIGVIVGIRVISFVVLGMHRVSWRYASARDIFPVVGSVLGSTLLIIPVVLFMWRGEFPRSIFVIDAVMNLLMVGGARYSYRLADELVTSFGAGRREKAIIIGAGSAGNLTVKAMLSSVLVKYWPVALLDDNLLKQKTTIQGVPVLGVIKDVRRIAELTGATAIILAIPTATSGEVYRVISECRKTGLPIKTIPDYGKIMQSSSAIARVKDFRIENLLYRQPVHKDVPEIGRFLGGRVILVTGAAGSIGSELCRQIVDQNNAGQLICMDKDENRLFRLEHLLKAKSTTIDIQYFLGDIKEARRLTSLFEKYRPNVVYHAAAYKHVPILQHHPVEAVANNVGGTRNLVRLADKYKVETFLFISTDKAVNPTSVMGATKRIAEKIIKSRDQISQTKFSTIRFGNVLGSNGSVIELFQKQIQDGQPLTVTHPDMERYFMTIPEAVHLVLFASTMGKGGEVFILDMGQPVKIDDLARQLIRLSGLVPDVDVPIHYTGLRPGEKLTEELWTDQEKPAETTHPGIRVAAKRQTMHDMTELVTSLIAAGEKNDLDGCWDGILGLVPSFRGNVNEAATTPPEEVPEKQASIL